MKFIEINSNNISILESFIRKLDQEKKTFRYFNNRDTSIINNHKYTSLLSVNNEIVGYGHIDFEDDKNWVGLVVLNEFQGKGYGKKILQNLLMTAKEKGLNNLYLTCDIENKKAIGLYQKSGFVKHKEEDDKYFMKMKV